MLASCASKLAPIFQDLKLVDALVAEGQGHLFADWPAPGERDDDKQRLLAQLRHLDTSYAGVQGLGGMRWWVKVGEHCGRVA